MIHPSITALSIVVAAIMVGGTAAAAEPVPTREQIERDLVLEATLKTPKIIQSGQPVVAAMSLRNRSRDVAYAVVRPGDGSESGWRPPYVYFTGTIQPPGGKPKPLTPITVMRCGLYDSHWQDEVEMLKPGAALSVEPWILPPCSVFEFQEAGRVQLFAHYQYGSDLRKGRKPNPMLDVMDRLSKLNALRLPHEADDPPAKPVTAGPMVGVPPFEIVSEPLELDVVRPLDVVLKVKAPLATKTKTRISEVLDIRLVNRTDKPIEVASPTLHAATRLVLQIEGNHSVRDQGFSMQASNKGHKLNLKPAEEVSLISAGALANGMDGDWNCSTAETFKVRAAYILSTWNPQSSSVPTGRRSRWLRKESEELLAPLQPGFTASSLIDRAKTRMCDKLIGDASSCQPTSIARLRINDFGRP